MSVDLATLAIKTDYSDVEGATGSLDKLSATSQKTERAMALMQIRAHAMNDAFDKGKAHVGAWDSIQQQAAGHTGEHSLAIGRLEKALAAIVGHFIGANNAAELLGSGLLKFSIGSLETVGILGGLALMVGLYEKMTEGMRAAKKQMDDMTDSLVKQARAAREATIAGKSDLALIAEYNKQTVGQESGIGWRSMLGTILTGKPFISGTDAENQAGRRFNAATGVDQTYADEAKARQDAHDAAMRKDEEAARKSLSAAEKLARLREAVAEWDGKQAELWKQQLEGIITWYGQIKNYTARSGFSFAIPESSMPNVGLNDGLTPAQIRQRKAMGINLTGDSAGGISGALQGAVSAYSPANIAGGLASKGLDFIASGLMDVATEFLSGGQAAREYARAMHQMTDEYKAAIAAFAHDDLAASLAQNAASADALRKQAQDTYLNVLAVLKDGGKAYRAELERIAKAEAANKLIIARQSGYALEDLAVRNMKALGQGDAGDLLAFREKQAREMQAALDSNKDALYINNLATTLNNELLGYLNGTLSSALRNAPVGFYGIPGWAGPYTTPRGPMNTDGGSVSGGGRDNSNGGLNAGSGKGAQTIILTVDGRVLTRVVVNGLDQFGSATSGAGSSRADALNRYPA